MIGLESGRPLDEGVEADSVYKEKVEGSKIDHKFKEFGSKGKI